MAEPTGLKLRHRLGIGRRELVAFVGAGGKSSLLLALGEELVSTNGGLVLTTTTKMGVGETPDWAVACFTLDEVAAALHAGRPAFLIGSGGGDKLDGVSPTVVDEVFTDLDADHVLVEADGARKRSLKAPAGHEPVIPPEATTVVVVAGLDAVGRRIADAAHRPELVAALLGGTVDDVLRTQDLAAVVSHPAGGLARIPPSARVVVALTKAEPDGAVEVEGQLASHPGIERVVVVPHVS